MDKTLAEVIMDRLLEMTCRAVKAEDALAEMTRQRDIFYGSVQRLEPERDALKKEVDQLKAKLNTYEGLEANDRGLL